MPYTQYKCPDGELIQSKIVFLNVGCVVNTIAMVNLGSLLADV